MMSSLSFPKSSIVRIHMSATPLHLVHASVLRRVMLVHADMCLPRPQNDIRFVHHATNHVSGRPGGGQFQANGNQNQQGNFAPSSGMRPYSTQNLQQYRCVSYWAVHFWYVSRGCACSPCSLAPDVLVSCFTSVFATMRCRRSDIISYCSTALAGGSNFIQRMSNR